MQTLKQDEKGREIFNYNGNPSLIPSSLSARFLLDEESLCFGREWLSGGVQY